MLNRSLRFSLGGVLAAAAFPLLVFAQPADLIITRAKIATLDAKSTIAEALAIRDGKILAVGDEATVQRAAGASTRRIDAGGRTVIPGLIDSHMHAVRAALTYATEVNWIGADTIGEAMARLRAAAARAKPGGWLMVVGGWSDKQFVEGRRPTPAEVLAAAPDHPVYIQFFYAAVLMTPKAMAALGMSPGTLPPRLEEEKDAGGNPTGWIKGDIIGVSALFDKLPKATYEENVEGTRLFFKELNRLAITGVVDPGGFSIAPSQYAPLFQVWRERALTVRVAYSVFSQNVGAEGEEFRNVTQMLPMGFGDDFLRFNGIGERVTAGMYNNNAPDDTAKSKFYEIVKWAAQRKLAVTVHWQSDASVHHLLALYEQLNKEVPITGLRWSIAHLDDATPESLARMKALGIGWTVQDAMYFQGDAMIVQRGQDASRIPPIGTAMRMGVNAGAGTDAHRVASYNPFVSLQWLVDGKTVSGKPTRAAAELPTREQALRLYTIGSAWFSFDDDRRGTLEPGKWADLAILDQDYFTVPTERIHKTVSLFTVVGGKAVYAARPFDELK